MYFRVNCATYPNRSDASEEFDPVDIVCLKEQIQQGVSGDLRPGFVPFDLELGRSAACPVLSGQLQKWQNWNEVPLSFNQGYCFRAIATRKPMVWIIFGLLGTKSCFD